MDEDVGSAPTPLSTNVPAHLKKAAVTYGNTATPRMTLTEIVVDALIEYLATRDAL